MKRAIIFSLFFLVLFSNLSLAEIWISNDSRDTWIETKNKSANHHDSVISRVGADLRSNGSNYYKSYIWFNISDLPSNASISEAFIKLFISTAPRVTVTHNIKRVTSDWDHRDVTWLNRPTNTDGVTDAASLIGGVEDIQNFIDGKNENYGWLIEEKLLAFNRIKDSDMRYRSNNYANSSVRPMLVVDYSI